MDYRHVIGGALAGLGVLWLIYRENRRHIAPSGPFLVMGDSIAVGVGQALPGACVGAQVGEGVEGTLSRLETRLAQCPQAKTVILSTGVNSLGAFPSILETIDEIKMRLRARGLRVIHLGPPRALFVENLEAYHDVIVADRDVVDLWALDLPMARDGLHPTRDGYAVIAREATS